MTGIIVLNVMNLNLSSGVLVNLFCDIYFAFLAKVSGNSEIMKGEHYLIV